MDKEERISDQIEGRNSVLELLESDRDINKILIAKGEKHGSINKIIALAKQKKIVIAEVERQKLNAISETERSDDSKKCAENRGGRLRDVPVFSSRGVAQVGGS